MHEAEAAHVAVPVAAPAVGAGVAYEGGQGGELARPRAWPFAPQASMRRCRSLRWSSRDGSGMAKGRRSTMGRNG